MRRRGYVLFSAGGAAVSADTSWILLAGVAAWALADAVIPALVPELSWFEYWASGFAATAGVMMLLLLYAWAAAMAARRFGLGYTRLAVWPFGCVADPVVPAVSWGRETCATLCAAAVPLVIGCALLLLLFQGAGPDTPLALAATGFTLAGATIGIAVMSLLPIYPFLGGRILAAILLRRLPRRRAVQLAVVPGFALGAGAVVGGAWIAIAGSLAVGTWVAMAGVILGLAAWRALSVFGRGDLMH